jgi:hypothetical protein
MRELVKPVQLLLCLCLVAFATLGFAQVRQINQRTVYGSGGFPYKITQPGSYILEGNLIVPAGSTDGIDISADNVTLDMNGFTISAACSPNVHTCSSGIGINSGNDNTKVTNGSVVGFSVGLQLSGSGVLLDKVSAKFNTTGVEIYGDGTVRNCSASWNSFFGMNLSYSVVEGNTFSNNGANGLVAFHSTVIANMFHGNQFGDMRGLRSVVGSNNFNDDPSVDSSNTSQNNNNCNGTTC